MGVDIRRAIFTISFLSVSTTSFADDYKHIINNSVGLSISENTLIEDNVLVYGVYIDKSVTLNNAGIIKGFINIASGYNIRIKNSGIIDTEVTVPYNSSLVQLIHEPVDVKPINVSNNFTVLVENANEISFNELQDISIGADKITIKDSSLILDSEIRKNGDEPAIELVGSNTLYVNNISSFVDRPLLSNIEGSGTINVYTNETTSLYRFSSYIYNSKLYVDLVRDTDYLKILGNSTGKFLNDLRLIDPDDKLLLALDAAGSMSEIKSIMANSVRLNPILLMDSVRMFNIFSINDVVKSTNGISVGPVFMFSDNFNATGISVDLGYNLSTVVNIGASLYAANLDFQNEFDNYKSSLYGGNVHVSYKDELLLARMMTGVTLADFDVEPIFDGEEVVANPSGKSVYSVADIGINVKLGSDFIVSPFVRGGFNILDILDFSDTMFVTGGGADIVIDAGMYDIDYTYGLNFAAYTNGMLSADFRMSVNSIADRAGGNINIGLVSDEFGDISYKAGVNVNFQF